MIKPKDPPPDFNAPDYWQRMGEWLLDERPMPEQTRADCFALCRSIPVAAQGELFNGR